MVRFTLADPLSPELDAFCSGNDEVDRYFKGRGWIKGGKYSPATYEIRTGDGSSVVGYASYAFKNMPHADASKDEKGRYLVIYALGFNERFQGAVGLDGADVRYSTRVLRHIEEEARKHPGCVGMSLWVRADNARALRCYERLGFVPDAGGPMQRGTGAPHLTMRKRF